MNLFTKSAPNLLSALFFGTNGIFWLYQLNPKQWMIAFGALSLIIGYISGLEYQIQHIDEIEREDEKDV